MVAVRPSPAHTERAGLVARRDGDGRPVRARGETARSGHPLARSRSKRGPFIGQALRDGKRPVAPSPARRPPRAQAAPTPPGAQPRPLRSLRDAAQPSKYGSPALEICISHSRDMHLPFSRYASPALNQQARAALVTRPLRPASGAGAGRRRRLLWHLQSGRGRREAARGRYGRRRRPGRVRPRRGACRRR